MKVKYNDRQSFTLIDDYQYINPTHIKLIGTNALENTSGFTIYNNNEVPLASFNDFTFIYATGKNYIEYTSDSNTYYVFDIYNSDRYLTGQTISTDNMMRNGILRTSGKGKQYQEAEPVYKYYDENGFYNYKVIDKDEFLLVTEVSKQEKEKWLEKKQRKELDNALNSKLAEIKSACGKAIINGIDYKDKHYSYEENDQKNLISLVNIALTTKMDLPYHADGEDCKLLTADDIINIYVAEENNVIKNTTYYNQLKSYVNTLKTKEEIEAIKYGETELDNDYKNVYTSLVNQGQRVIQKFIEQ